MGRRRFEQLPGFFSGLEAAVNAGITRKMQAASVAAKETAVRATRADTGAARSNWITTLHQPATSIRGPYAPGRKLGFGEQGNAQGAINQGLSVTRAFNARLHTTIFHTNNVPYIEKLNFGSAFTPGDQMIFRGAQAGRAAAARLPLLRGLRGRSGR